MLQISKPESDRIDIALDGPIDAEIMRAALDDFIAQAEGVHNGRLMYVIENFEMPTWAAIGVEFTKLPKLMALVGKFKRAAVVSNLEWVRTASEIEGALIPGLRIKAFPSSEKAEAESWLQHEDA